MKARGWSIGLAVLCIVLPAAAQTGAVSTPASRDALLKDLAVMLSDMPVGGVAQFAKVKDPFHPPPGDLTDTPTATNKNPTEIMSTVMSDSDLLQILAAKIRPSGSGEIGGEPFLLFVEKRLKIGDKIPVTHEGIEYSLEIVSIESNRLKLRYHSQEIVRAIK
jgi:hypothetical protein